MLVKSFFFIVCPFVLFSPPPPLPLPHPQSPPPHLSPPHSPSPLSSLLSPFSSPCCIPIGRIGCYSSPQGIPQGCIGHSLPHFTTIACVSYISVQFYMVIVMKPELHLCTLCGFVRRSCVQCTLVWYTVQCQLLLCTGYIWTLQSVEMQTF